MSPSSSRPAAIGARVEHRPWPLPDRPWILAQSWQHLLFAHWPIAPDILRPLLPGGLTLDTFDGQAWIGIVPFLMSDVHLRRLPAIPSTASFPELNVRTYVVSEDKSGVWFFSLDASSRLAVTAARLAFHLPYYNARMSLHWDDDRIEYHSERTHRQAAPAVFSTRYQPTSDVYQSKSGTLDYWLTERYCLYAANRHGHLFRGEIHHAPWPLQQAEADFQVNTMARSHDIELPNEKPLLHYAQRLDVITWYLRQVG